MAFSKSEVPRVTAQQVVNTLVILPKSAKPREAGGLNEGVAEILRVAQDDSLVFCHPEQREGSLADLGRITS